MLRAYQTKPIKTPDLPRRLYFAYLHDHSPGLLSLFMTARPSNCPLQLDVLVSVARSRCIPAWLCLPLLPD